MPAPNLKFDRSSLFLVLSNLVTIVVAVADRWSLAEVMWIYWAQSVVIGFSNWRRMLHLARLTRFSTDGFTYNDRPVPETRAGGRSVAMFFAFHYGFFHLVYFFFLTAERPHVNIPGALVCVAVFAANHWFSYRHNLEADLGRRPNIGTMMFFPYARIIPMHLTIIIAGGGGEGSAGTLVLFLGLKTLADLIMHMVEHRGQRITTTGTA